jgi:F-type H+/Na+-transporting ATPase subunit alpha
MNMETESLQSAFDTSFDSMRRAREAFAPYLSPRGVGAIVSLATGSAKVSGLPGVGVEEPVTFPGHVLGIAFNVDAEEVEFISNADCRVTIRVIAAD